MIDSHCHLDFQVFDRDRESIVQTCLSLGVDGLLVPSTTVTSFNKVLELAKRYPVIRPALGLHPYFLNGKVQSDLEELSVYLEKNDVVAVGEIGLDNWPGCCDLDVQIEVFESQLKIAKAMSLPVILHARKSEDLLLKSINRLKFDCGGIVHAFNGSLDQAKRLHALGFVFGVGGTITYERAKKARRVLASLPDSAIVLETDSPDMPLHGYQGEPNMPYRVLDVARCVSEIRGQSVDMVSAMTTNNLKRTLPNW
ncbi:TatD family hydrolase [Marinomonas mediterranea]|nr:TatD family hydrolase [Marinomonas mediterranea]WCN10465.1 TatD family deoxyribonuclease [Marinomonas mediterranea]WCN14513.1 TatD family deoxyribonuclease [Marinomonas mediterranea]WCN18564.1 TatD family deoxyribonuclease [Marinomonas mediterranea MMB-1]